MFTITNYNINNEFNLFNKLSPPLPKNSKKKVAQPQFYRESSNPVENQSETFPRRGIKITGRGESAQSPLHFPFPVPLLRLAGPGEGKSWKMKGRSLKGERERERGAWWTKTILIGSRRRETMVAAWRCLAKARGEGCDWVVGKGWGGRWKGILDYVRFRTFTPFVHA